MHALRTAASEEDVKSFFRVYYSPSNCILAIVGDFDPAQTRAWVTKYFGDLQRSQPFARPAVAPVTLAEEKRLIYEDRVQVPRLYLQWPTIGQRSDDRFALQVLAFVLTGGRTARLTKPSPVPSRACSQSRKWPGRSANALMFEARTFSRCWPFAGP